MTEQVIEFSVKLTKIKFPSGEFVYCVSLDPHQDPKCDILYRTRNYVDANRFFAGTLCNIDYDMFALINRTTLQNGDIVAIFRSTGSFQWNPDPEIGK